MSCVPWNNRLLVLSSAHSLPLLLYSDIVNVSPNQENSHCCLVCLDLHLADSYSVIWLPCNVYCTIYTKLFVVVYLKKMKRMRTRREQDNLWIGARYCNFTWRRDPRRMCELLPSWDSMHTWGIPSQVRSRSWLSSFLFESPTPICYDDEL